jgi:6-phosphogluconolactonase (cycloisomerase 2 family)
VLAGSVVDHLASQGSLALDRRAGLLYAVNAGSDTITVFAVRGDRLVRRQVLGSGGSFPVSLAVRDNVVYVLNARDGGSLQGYRRVGERLVTVPGRHRDLGLDPTAAPEFTHTPGQVTFTPDGRALLVTTKANGNAVDVFRVDRFGGLSASPAVTGLPGAVPFAATFDAGGNVVLTEAGPNAVQTFALGRGGALTSLAQALTGQAATCWIVRAGARFYASNAGSGSLSGDRDESDGSLAPLGDTPTDAGTVDAAVSADGRALYMQTGATGTVDVFRIHHDGPSPPSDRSSCPAQSAPSASRRVETSRGVAVAASLGPKDRREPAAGGQGPVRDPADRQRPRPLDRVLPRPRRAPHRVPGDARRTGAPRARDSPVVTVVRPRGVGRRAALLRHGDGRRGHRAGPPSPRRLDRADVSAARRHRRGPAATSPGVDLLYLSTWITRSASVPVALRTWTSAKPPARANLPVPPTIGTWKRV